MKQLSRQAFSRASQFINTKARPLEQARFNYHFKDCPAKEVAIELSEFQKSSGGFGLDLEPDLRSPSSSPLASAIGLQILSELGYSSDFNMVRNCVSYLLDTYDEEIMTWRPTPRDSNEYPHAPWWHDEDNSLFETFDGFRIIPRLDRRFIAPLL